MLYWDGKQYHPIASEGGHGDFGPRTDLEVELLRYLRREVRRPRQLRAVLSGPGFSNIYGFLRDRGGVPESPEDRREAQDGRPQRHDLRAGPARRADPCAPRRSIFSARSTAPRRATWPLPRWRSAGSSSAAASRPRSSPRSGRGGFLAELHRRRAGSPTSSKRIDVRVALNPRPRCSSAPPTTRALGSVVYRDHRHQSARHFGS